MAIARRADPVELAGAVAAETRSPVRIYVRRWLPIGIGTLMAVAMIVAAAAAPLLAPPR